jgi:hypothetical protein
VDIVHQTLELFGFEVTNVDEGLAEGQAKKEDLRVEDGDWIALCEVKGYSKGGKLADLQKLNGFGTLYAVETGRPPKRNVVRRESVSRERPEYSTAAASGRRRIFRDVRAAGWTRHRYARSVPATKSG